VLEGFELKLGTFFWLIFELDLNHPVIYKDVYFLQLLQIIFISSSNNKKIAKKMQQGTNYQLNLIPKAISFISNK
jgi:hypothetical protein